MQRDTSHSDELLASIANLIRDRPIVERNLAHTDDVLHGLLQVLSVLVANVGAQRKLWLGKQEKFVALILHYLFEIPQPSACALDTLRGPKCKTYHTRE